MGSYMVLSIIWGSACYFFFWRTRSPHRMAFILYWANADLNFFLQWVNVEWDAAYIKVIVDWHSAETETTWNDIRPTGNGKSRWLSKRGRVRIRKSERIMAYTSLRTLRKRGVKFPPPRPMLSIRQMTISFFWVDPDRFLYKCRQNCIQVYAR